MYRAFKNRRGLSLVELMSAVAVLALIAGTLGALALAVQQSSDYAYGHGAATQHARVTIERIERKLSGATASEDFPGFAAFAETVSSYEFPDTLVIWSPTGTATDPTGLPRYQELLIFCPDPADATTLLEIRPTGDSRTVPALSDTTTWQTELAAIKADTSLPRVELTNLLKTGDVAGNDRAAVRFSVVVRPDDDAWQAYQGGSVAWDDLAWVQDVHGPSTGLRQAWCRFELQLMPGEESRRSDPIGDTAIPFFGSGAIYYQLER